MSFFQSTLVSPFESPLVGIQGFRSPIDDLLSPQAQQAATKTDQSAQEVFASSSHTSARRHQFIAAPASFEHADQTMQEGLQQNAEGMHQIGRGIDALVGDHKPFSAFEQIKDGARNVYEAEVKYAQANSEMMQAAREQIEASRDAQVSDVHDMNESHGPGGSCIIT